MMRYSGIQDDNEQQYRPSQHVARAAREPIHLPRDVSERNARDVSEWAASPEPLAAGGKSLGAAVRKVPLRSTGSGGAVIRNAKDRDSGNVPDLPPRLVAGNERGVKESSAASVRTEGGPKISVSNVEFQLDSAAPGGFMQHAGARVSRPPVLQVMQKCMCGNADGVVVVFSVLMVLVMAIAARH
jgi:hypothetical protein